MFYVNHWTDNNWLQAAELLKTPFRDRYFGCKSWLDCFQVTIKSLQRSHFINFYLMTAAARCVRKCWHDGEFGAIFTCVELQDVVDFEVSIGLVDTLWLDDIADDKIPAW